MLVEICRSCFKTVVDIRSQKHGCKGREGFDDESDEHFSALAPNQAFGAKPRQKPSELDLVLLST